MDAMQQLVPHSLQTSTINWTVKVGIAQLVC